MEKSKVLFLVQLPKPIHGASMVNLSIKESDYINSNIVSRYVDISPAKEMVDLGKASFGKVLSTLRIFSNSISSYFQFKPDLVYITLSPHGLGFYKDALILCILKLFGANAVVHLHGKGIKDIVSNSSFKMALYKYIFRKVSVIHLSKSLFKDVEPVLDRQKPIIEVNNGVKEQGVLDKVPGQKLTFVYLSNLEPTKGVDTLVKAINSIESEYKNKFKVKIVGKVTNEKFYRELMDSVEPNVRDNIEFVGPLYGDSKHRVLLNSDVFVLPTRFRNECFPLSILEAMSFNLPVISTFEGAIPDIVRHNECGLLFDAKDEKELSNLMKYYIDNPEVVEMHGSNAKKRLEEKYTLHSFEKALLEAIKKVSRV